MQSFKQGVSGVAGLTYSYAVETSPDGRHLYTISGTDNGFAWYTRNTSTGMLAYGGFVANDNGTVEYPWDMDISADGSAIGIYLVNKGVISLFRRDTVSGQTTFQNQSAWAFISGDQPPIINGEGMVVFSPDGRFIYQTSRIYDRIIWFRRNHQPLLDSSSAVGDTVDLAEGDSLLFRLYARDTDAGDSLRYIWIHRGGRLDTVANAFMLRTDYSSLRIDSLRAGVSDGLDTTWRSWVLRIANTGIAPQVVRPVNGDTISADTLLVWQEWSDPDLGNAIRYRLQFSTDSLFGDTLLTRDDLGVESGSLRSLQIEDSLPEGVPIYWRVKAHETQGYTYETPFSDGPTWFYYQPPSAVQRGVMAMAPARPSVAVLGNARGGHLALALSVPASTQATRQSVAVDILDFGGRIVLTPFRGGLEAGVHRVRIPAPVSGTYLVRMRIDGAVVHTVRCAVAD